MSESALIIKELARLTPSALIELYILDATELGGGKLYFYDGLAQTPHPGMPNLPVVFQGVTYHPMPISVKGFEFKSRGELPRPNIRFSNLMGIFTALGLMFDDLVSAKLTRKRTLRKFLDDGEEPNPLAEMPEDVYYVDRKMSENKLTMEFELGTILDVEGLSLPKRQVTANICSWIYRGAECAFAQNRFVSDATGVQYPKNLPDWTLARYAGAYSPSKTYVAGMCVSYVHGTDDERFYKYIGATPQAGRVVTEEAYWRQLQRFRGQWKATDSQGANINYHKYDVVYIVSKGVRQYFMLINRDTVAGASYEPPNTLYWVADRCGKTLSQCRMRQDSLALNLPITFGAFPGTSRVPETV